MTQPTPRDAVTAAWESNGHVNDALCHDRTPGGGPTAALPGDDALWSPLRDAR